MTDPLAALTPGEEAYKALRAKFDAILDDRWPLSGKLLAAVRQYRDAIAPSPDVERLREAAQATADWLSVLQSIYHAVAQKAPNETRATCENGLCGDYRQHRDALRAAIEGADPMTHAPYDDWYCKCGHPYDLTVEHRPAPAQPTADANIIADLVEEIDRLRAEKDDAPDVERLREALESLQKAAGRVLGTTLHMDYGPTGDFTACPCPACGALRAALEGADHA